jgi:hypothetical protein
MSYLLKDFLGNYYNLSGKIIEPDLEKALKVYGFPISDLLKADKELIRNKRLVSVSNVYGCTFNMKDSYDFLLIKINAPFANIYVNASQNMLVSENGTSWLNYLNENTYIIEKFNISLDSFTSITQKQKLELAKIKNYIVKNTQKINFINNPNIKYMFIKLDSKLDRIFYKRTFDENAFVDIDGLNIDISKSVVTITNNKLRTFDNLHVHIINIRDYKKDTLEEF